MAGTIVSDTVQNGAGVSTSTTNVINGCAKAWVNFNSDGATTAIRASYNVSSVTYISTGYFTVNFTNALADANYVVTGNASVTAGTDPFSTVMPFSNWNTGALITPTTSAFNVSVGQLGYSGRNTFYSMISVFR
jgi:hypothetical protein